LFREERRGATAVKGTEHAGADSGEHQDQIHGLLVSRGMEDTRACLQSKRGRQKIQDTLAEAGNGLVVQPLFDTIEALGEKIKAIEAEIEKLMADDKAVKLLQTIPGCGPVTAWTIRAYTDDIRRFARYKQYSSYASLVPWVECSNETVHYGRITKRGPEELRTAFVQLVMGIRAVGRHFHGGLWCSMSR